MGRRPSTAVPEVGPTPPDVGEGHTGVAGNDAADRKRVWQSTVEESGYSQTRSPAGIRQEYPIHPKPKHLGWDRKSMKGLTYIMTDRGPLRSWLKKIGRREDDRCDWGSIQNAAHLIRYPLVGDGKGRAEDHEDDEDQVDNQVEEFFAYIFAYFS